MSRSNLAVKAQSRAGAPEPHALLAWYDRHRRDLPWRAKPGEAIDPYRVWLSEIMLQQTRVETVARYYDKFLAKFPTVEKLAKAPLGEVLKLWAGLGYYARARNLHACARVVAKEHGGRFPETEEGLRELPGIGGYTAAAIAAIAFGKKAAPVDGNIERVVARLFRVETPLPVAKSELQTRAASLVPRRAGDFAQAMMDLGAMICTPKNPSCLLCPWSDVCAAHLTGEPEAHPRRMPKAEGKLRCGAAFVVLRADETVLLRRRPRRGLLGGMTEVPNTEWSATFDEKTALQFAPCFSPSPGSRLRRSPPSPRNYGEREERRASGAKGEGQLRWHRKPGYVRHIFTHFPLELSVYLAKVPVETVAPKGMRFAKIAKLESEALPSLMKKVVAHALND
ncbi:MAG TPA: A/G-specific adenine glycosylase [Xanthobacteraceae bacterium]|nr:A/G-specific adenine glycosylase [Xanthobacteraceae bacterium]